MPRMITNDKKLKIRLILVVSALVVASALFGVVYGYYSQVAGTSRHGADTRKTVPEHTATNMRADFYESLSFPNPPSPIDQQVFGGIVSHHLYMEGEIGKLFLQLKNQRPSVVVVVGPNHFNAGDAGVQVSRATFHTPFGELYPATESIEALIKQGVVLNEERPFESEHAIGALVPYIRSVWPNAKFVPIILKRTATPAQTEELALALANTLPKDALVLASVDFSHHLDRFAASFHDSQSMAALQNLDFARLRALEVDSPQSLEVLMRYLESRGALKMQYTNTNQALYSGNLLSDDVTSYTFAAFTSGKENPSSQTATLLHLGEFAEQLLRQPFSELEALGGPEQNLFRGGDLKIVASDPGGEACGISTLEQVSRFKFYKALHSSCEPGSTIVSEFTSAPVRYVYVGEGNVNKLLRGKTGPGWLVTEVSSVSKARQAVDVGADAVFIYDGLTKVDIYKNKPLIHLGSAGKPGFGTGLAFTTQGVTAYIFPFEHKDKKPFRPDIDARLRICGRILDGLKNVDGCRVEVGKQEHDSQ